MKKIKCSIGVIAYNEAANIGKLLDALLNQELESVQIERIVVVSSGCTDGTDDIVTKYEKKNKKIKLITEAERGGKSSAINKFIKAAESEVLVIESGDTIPAENTVERMVAPFADEKVGMTGGKPVPENDPKTFIGYAVNLLWKLHHHMALRSPKLGEMVAFRRIFEEIPPESAVDEASIEAIMKEKNLELKYIPDAIVHNKGPENISDFIKQRRRIEAGHLWLRQNQDYEVSSQNHLLLLELAIQEIKRNPDKLHFLFGTAILEVYSRLLGMYDFKVKKKNPFKWDIADSTKNLDHR
ncbi:MAG: glycosyltransferase [Candidatus Cloacimonetes bacterium]|nr:glycosyltransferase [Candidatus Cloacimonadota bacterium]MCF7814571.1 glycosyltransferase [Candidatus Cloacimonadota bacterium]MCF7867763.1 glycosyltransferase [Candidatus Cloacimonadota bacterium]MCF7883259.1 glycosyltransferase [Candidatus Cloacimonadota bacterium]